MGKRWEEFKGGWEGGDKVVLLRAKSGHWSITGAQGGLTLQWIVDIRVGLEVVTPTFIPLGVYRIAVAFTLL